MGTNIVNNLEAKTKEKIRIMSGPEFGTLKYHMLIINKALHRLLTPGLHCHEGLVDHLRHMGFQPCKTEPEIFMRRVDNNKDRHYEHMSVCAYDSLIASKSLQTIVDALINKHGFKLKCTGPVSYLLGCDFSRNGNKDL